MEDSLNSCRVKEGAEATFYREYLLLKADFLIHFVLVKETLIVCDHNLYHFIAYYLTLS